MKCVEPTIRTLTRSTSMTPDFRPDRRIGLFHCTYRGAVIRDSTVEHASRSSQGGNQPAPPIAAANRSPPLRPLAGKGQVDDDGDQAVHVGGEMNNRQPAHWLLVSCAVIKALAPRSPTAISSQLATKNGRAEIVGGAGRLRAAGSHDSTRVTAPPARRKHGDDLGADTLSILPWPCDVPCRGGGRRSRTTIRSRRWQKRNPPGCCGAKIPAR